MSSTNNRESLLFYTRDPLCMNPDHINNPIVKICIDPYCQKRNRLVCEKCIHNHSAHVTSLIDLK